MAAQLRFAKLHLNKPQYFSNNVIWRDQTKVEVLRHNTQCQVFRKPNTANQHLQLLSTVKHGAEGLLLCSRFAATQDMATGVDHELLSIQKYCRVKCEAICLTSKAYLEMGHETGQ